MNELLGRFFPVPLVYPTLRKNERNNRLPSHDSLHCEPSTGNDITIVSELRRTRKVANEPSKILVCRQLGSCRSLGVTPRPAEEGSSFLRARPRQRQLFGAPRFTGRGMIERRIRSKHKLHLLHVDRRQPARFSNTFHQNGIACVRLDR
jgi:hypothetical protein